MIGLSCPRFSLMPIADIGPKIAEHFDMWEIVAEGEHFLPIYKKELIDFMGSYDTKIQIHAPISDVNIGSLNARMRSRSFDNLYETMDIAHTLGIETITLHPGYLSPLAFYAPKKAKELGKKSLQDLDKVNNGYGLRLCVENMPNVPILTCFTSSEIEEMIDGTSMLACLDVGHANTNENLADFANLVPKIGNVHIHDNNGDHDAHLVIGEGTVDWKQVKDLLKDYTGNYIIESTDLEPGIESLKNLSKMKWG